MTSVHVSGPSSVEHVVGNLTDKSFSMSVSASDVVDPLGILQVRADVPQAASPPAPQVSAGMLLKDFGSRNT